MAKIGTADIASRYDGLSAGPRFEYSFETQVGIPVDGSNALLRELSPFTLRILPPDALLATAFNGGLETNNAGAARATSQSVNLISAVASGADLSKVAKGLGEALARVTAIEATTEVLESFVSSGQFLANQGGSYFPTIADAVVAADIALQVRRALEMPPLTLLINPKEMNINYTNIQSYVSRTRFGYVFERWGEEQPTISFSGSTGAFIAGVARANGTDPFADQVTNTTSGPSGVQFASKRDSAAWQNLMALYQFYRNNGYIFDNANGTEAHQFIGTIAIDYDQWTYVGTIESFEYSYEENIQHRMEWSIEFRVSAMFDNGETTAVVLPQIAPTSSPSSPTFSANSARNNRNNLTFGEILSAASSTASGILGGNATTDPEDLGETPFELLV